MRKRTAEPIKWDTPERIEGVLEAIEEKPATAKMAANLVYRYRDVQGPRVFFGTTQINRELSHEDIGHFFTLAYLGEKKTSEWNTAKLFIIEVDDQPYNGQAGG